MAPAFDLDTSTLVRFSGACYAIIIFCGVYSEMGIRQPLIDHSSAAKTAENIEAHQALFLLGFVGDSLMVICDITLAVCLFSLLKPVSVLLSLAAAVFRLIQAATLAVNILRMLNLVGPLLLIGKTSSGLAELQPAQLHGFAMFFLDMQKYGYDLGLIFFGINCILTGLLVSRSEWPRMLGYLLIPTGAVYLIGSYLRFLAPSLHRLFAPAYLVPFLAETALCVYLLIYGKDPCDGKKMGYVEVE
mmetsp:Transcript_27689/g.65666  ORF Transcript_27689/g.65666 Transcript_27689/m.65666 type:complete len:245 (+) Transcript_27689:30-764(+)